MPDSPVYFDYAATTPLDERVLQAMLPYWTDGFGNPSSIHSWGQAADAALDAARQTVARCLNAQSSEIIFTSGGSESDNLALRATALARREQTGANRILISPVEHPAVSQTAQQLATHFGFQLDVLPVDSTGQVNPADVKNALRDDTALVSIIFANNEIGTINPIAEIGAICHNRGIPLHSDAVQAAAHLPLNLATLPVDLLSIGAHKFYGPKGVGALFVRKGTPFLQMQTGGGQENGRRAGTENIPLIVGLAQAFSLAATDMPMRNLSLVSLRDRLISSVLTQVPDSRLTGHPSMRLPNHASFAFQHVDGNTLLMLLDQAGFACSSGSACKVGNPKPSEILLAIGLHPAWAAGSLRVTLGKTTTLDQIERFCLTLPELIQRYRSRK